jgi:hypothetical protein
MELLPFEPRVEVLNNERSIFDTGKRRLRGREEEEKEKNEKRERRRTAKKKQRQALDMREREMPGGLADQHTQLYQS